MFSLLRLCILPCRATGMNGITHPLPLYTNKCMSHKPLIFLESCVCADTGMEVEEL